MLSKQTVMAQCHAALLATGVEKQAQFHPKNNKNVIIFVRLSKSNKMLITEEEFVAKSEAGDIAYVQAHITEMSPSALALAFVKSQFIPVCEIFLKFGIKATAWARIVPYTGEYSIPEECSALYYACRQNNIEKVKWLLKNGADIEQGYRRMPHSMDEYEESTPLKVAVATGNEELVKLLLSYKANVNNNTNSFETALDVSKKSQRVQDLLKTYGAKTNAEIIREELEKSLREKDSPAPEDK